MTNWKQITKEYIDNDLIFLKLEKYVSLILEKNQKYNLTGFKEDQLWLEGIYQSIFLLDKSIEINDESLNMLDIGAGAGFPSIPYFIFKNNKNIFLTIYEPILKRVNFLNEVIKTLNLKNIFIVNKRIEDDKQANEKFDVITARAVMPLKQLAEISSFCGKINSSYYFLKSKNAKNELEESKWIFEKLDIENVHILNYDLNDNKTHNIVFYKKIKTTPKEFPRKWSEIKKEK